MEGHKVNTEVPTHDLKCCHRFYVAVSPHRKSTGTHGTLVSWLLSYQIVASPTDAERLNIWSVCLLERTQNEHAKLILPWEYCSRLFGVGFLNP